MKARTLLLCGIAVVLLFGSYTEAQGSDWIPIGSDGKKSEYYYDKKSFNYSKKENDRVVTTWTNTQYSIVGRLTDKAVPDKEKDMLTIPPGYRLDLEEYNCSQKKYRMIQVIFYNDRGGVIKNANFEDDPSWTIIAPDSVAEMVRNTVCAAGLLKKKKTRRLHSAKTVALGSAHI